jgi:hypothetical protein
MAQENIKIIKDDHRKLDSIVSEIRSFKNSYVKVGVLEGTQEKVKYTDKKGRKRTKLSIMMAMIAAVQEYGSPKQGIPERSFIRSWVEGSKTEINQMLLRLLQAVEDGKLTSYMALKKLGAFGVGGIRKKISTGPFKRLAESTIRRKKSSKPLIDTGQLRNGIHYKVEQKR